MTPRGPAVTSSVSIHDRTANPAPLGLMGFGMTTVLLNLHNAGLFDLNAAILAMGIFFGGLAQVVAGLMEWKKGNTFGMTAFTSYGFFWLSLVGLLILPMLGLGEAADKTTMAWFLTLWGVFTAVMYIGTLRTTRALQFVFVSLAVLFFALAMGDALNNPEVTKLAGFIGIICGLSAMYTGLGQVQNEVHGYEIVPLWPMSKKERSASIPAEVMGK
jgi:succinate-acetate transporter protein